nr:hypothetical protein [Tanacetum cinerariifolium]
MRNEGCATWDGGNSTWGGRARVIGTVSVCVRVKERAGIAIRVPWCRPMRNEGCATWDGGNSTWGGRARVIEYDCFLFKVEPNSRDFTKDVVEDISPIKEPKVYNALPTHPTLQLNLKFQPSSESLFTYVVWLFLPFLVYSVAPRYLLSLRSEDTIFDPGICNSHFSRPNVSHRCETFPRFKVLPESLMETFSFTCSPMDK